MTKSIKTFPKESGLDRMFRQDRHSVPESLNEIIDNARDKEATKVNILKVGIEDKNYLLITNNGSPIDNWESMLSAGASNKHKSTDIGHYGVGLNHFLSFFNGKDIIIFSKENKSKPLVFFKKSSHEEYTWNSYFDSPREESKASPLYVIAAKYMKDYPTGVLFLLELDDKLETKFVDIEVVEKSAQAFAKIKNLSIYFNNKEIKKEDPLAKGKKEKIYKNPLFPEASITHYIIPEGAKTQDLRGLFVRINQRLINSVTDPQNDRYVFYKNHHKNGHILELNFKSNQSVAILDEMISFTNQKNGFKIDRKSELFKWIKEVEKLIDPAVQDSLSHKKKTSALIKSTTAKEVFKIKEPVKKVSDTSVKALYCSFSGDQFDKEMLADLGSGSSLTEALKTADGFKEIILNKKDSKAYMVRKVTSDTVEELKKFFYYIEILNEWKKENKLIVYPAIVCPKVSNTKELQQIKKMLIDKGVLIKEIDPYERK